MMHEFFSIFIRNTVKQGRSLTHMVSPDEIQHDNPLPMITIVSLFGSWSVAWFSVSWLSWAEESIRTCFSWSVSKILWWYTICYTLGLNSSHNLELDCSAASFLVRWTQAHWNVGKRQCGVNGVQALRPATFPENILPQQFFLQNDILITSLAHSN